MDELPKKGSFGISHNQFFSKEMQILLDSKTPVRDEGYYEFHKKTED